MRLLFPIAAALTLGMTVACAQNGQQAVVAPLDRSTGPTVPGSADTRMHDQNTAVAPSADNGTSGSVANDLGYSNWRTSDGLNSDPDNPNGAPGPSTITGSSRINR